MPVTDLLPGGRVETFDGWYRRADDPPVADTTTGRIEAWSRDWFRLTGGRGWVHSAVASGMQPPGLAPAAWSRPAVMAAATAGIVDVALDHQDQNATCEAASLKMALAATGVATDEGRILSITGVDARPPEEGADGRIVRWGNPNTAFVGDPNGTAAAHTGYGVYAGPIARAAAALGRPPVRSGAGVSPASVYAAVIAGRPVVAWVTSNYRHEPLSTWRAWDGTEVSWSVKEHAVTVVGVTPSSVVIDDPWWGTLWKSRADFESAYDTFGGMAVIIG